MNQPPDWQSNSWQQSDSWEQQPWQPETTSYDIVPSQPMYAAPEYPTYAAPAGPPPVPPTPPAPNPRSGRGWILAVVAGVAVVLCVCAGVIAGIGGLGYFGFKVDKADSVAALREYLSAVRSENYPVAYGMLCDRAKASLGQDGYTRRASTPKLTDYTLAEPATANRSGEIGYDIDVAQRFDDGQSRTDTFFVFSDSDDVSVYHVCPLGW